MEIELLEARLKHVTEQRDRAWRRLQWFCDMLSKTRMSHSQQEIKKQVELEVNIELYQVNFEPSVPISEDIQYQKLTTFPLRGQLIG
jgi:hypothetical protein